MTDAPRGEIVIVEPDAESLEPLEPAARRLVRSFLRALNPNTFRAYTRDLDDFAAFLKVPGPEAAAELLLRSSQGRANERALDYRDYLILKGKRPATVNRRLSALRSMVKLGRRLGMIAWSLEVDSIDTKPYRDTKGPGSDKVQVMLQNVGGGAKGIRDAAIVRLLHDRGFRRGEVCDLDLKHYDRERGVFVMGKGRKDREWFSLPSELTAAIEAWLEIRGDEPGAMFTSLDHANFGHRLTGTSVYQIIRKLGARAGVVTRPHGLRHAGITRALKMTNGNVAEVQSFSRHARADTVMIYNDAVDDAGGRIAAMVALPDGSSPMASSGPGTPPPGPLEATGGPPATSPAGPHWRAFVGWMAAWRPGEDPQAPEASSLGSFLRDYRGDRRAAADELARLRAWTPAEIAVVNAAMRGGGR